MSDLIQALKQAFSRVGYDPRIGAMGSFTVKDPEVSSPLTSGAMVPFAPGLVRVPADRPLSPEEVVHEGTHANLGAPGAFAGKLLGMIAGTGTTGGYTDPDEALAYLSQPNTPATKTDMQAIQSVIPKNTNNPYMWLLNRATGIKAAEQ